MPNSRLLLVIPLLALAPALAGAAEATTTAQATTTQAPATLPDWAPKPKPNVVEDRLRLEINLLWASPSTKLRVDESPTQPGTEINAEDDLGLDDSQLLPQVELTLLPGERHLIRLSRFAIDRSAAKHLEKNISFDDQDYLVGERVDSILNLTMFGLTYGYRFIRTQQAEISASFGVQIADVETNAVVRNRVVRESENGVAPLPLLGIEGRYDFSPRWSAEARVQYLTVNETDVDGSILDARLGVTWRMNPYLLFGLGYRTFQIDIDSADEDTSGFVDLTVAGPLLFVRASM
ncbi:MAG TPA: hypothetical protein VL494_22195 [Steroidobacteraceae bacterium]|jgi:hypothetical protein|nr:hypothetical protein [Steroidobacteraceae bacterium]